MSTRFFAILVALVSISHMSLARDMTTPSGRPSLSPAANEAIAGKKANIPSEVVDDYNRALPPLQRREAPRIIFVPGILGSQIDECQTDGSQCKSIWGTAESILNVVDLSLRTDRKYRTDVVDQLFFYEIYGGLLNSIRREAKRFGPGKIDDPFLTVFPYDWRQSNVYNANLLAKRVCIISQAAPKSPILIIAHSMGGIISKIWAKRHASTECADGKPPRNIKIVFVATPHLGSPKTLKAFIEKPSKLFPELGRLDYPLSFWQTNNVVKSLNEVGHTFASIYELLPIKASKTCRRSKPSLKDDKIPIPFEGDNGRPVDLFDATKWREYDLLHRIGPAAVRTPFYKKSLPRLLRNAETILCELVDFNPASVSDVLYVAGRQPTNNTLGWFKLIPQPPSQIDKLRNVEGDGTVPLYSAKNHVTSRTSEVLVLQGQEHLGIVNASQILALLTARYNHASAEAKIKLAKSNPQYRSMLITEIAATGTFLPISLNAKDWTDENANLIATLNSKALKLSGVPPSKVAAYAKIVLSPEKQAQLFALAAQSSDTVSDRLIWTAEMAKATYTAGHFEQALASSTVVIESAKQVKAVGDSQFTLTENLAKQVIAWSHLKMGDVDKFQAIVAESVQLIEEPSPPIQQYVKVLHNFKDWDFRARTTGYAVGPSWATGNKWPGDDVMTKNQKAKEWISPN